MQDTATETAIVGFNYHHDNDVTLFHGDCLDFLNAIDDNTSQLIVTSPPYNIGKKYEKKISINDYLDNAQIVISTCIRKLKPGGSICWQVGNFVDNGEIVPLDIVLHPFFAQENLFMRNRIIWHFGHGLHCSNRFSGRYETVLWYTKNDENGNYVFNLDAVRVPQKYPGKKYFKGPKKGQLSGNPLGKNPGDYWTDCWEISNVKHNHPEKTEHPCQFPMELVNRLVLALSNEGDLVVDPYVGSGTTLQSAYQLNRKSAGAELSKDYFDISLQRINDCIKTKNNQRSKVSSVV